MVSRLVPFLVQLRIEPTGLVVARREIDAQIASLFGCDHLMDALP